MEIKTLNPEVYQAEGQVVWATRENIEFLKQRAAENPRGRARLCTHPDGEDPIHEMLVVLTRENYLHPHIHPGNIESFHLIEGLMTVVLFREDGSVLESVPMGDLKSGRAFYYRMTIPLFHTLLQESDFVVFKEATRGPFRRGTTVLAPWAPGEGPDGKLRAYLDELRKGVRKP